MADYTVFVNGVPITPRRERTLQQGERTRFSRNVELDLFARDNTIRVETFNGTSMGVAETYIGLDRDHPPPPRNGDLYLLAVGVNKFSLLPESMHLEFAAQDAEAMTRILDERAKPYFRKVHIHLVNDFSSDKPNRAEIVAALDFIGKARAEDTSVLFLASHGVSDPAGNYYFVPRDTDLADVRRVSKGETGPSLLGWQVFFDALRGAAGHRVLIVDTCHSQSIEGRFESHSLLKRSAASLFPMLVSSKSDERSQEYPPANQGLFTYAIMQSMTAQADKNRDGALSLAELFEWSNAIVKRLQDAEAGTQTPQFVGPAGLGESVLVQFPGANRQ
jgi:uncharacterized caspase-like protein